MRIRHTKTLKDGTLHVLVELKPTEKLMSIDPKAHYSLGEPLRGEVMSADVLLQATPVSWCSVTQKWVEC